MSKRPTSPLLPAWIAAAALAVPVLASPPTGQIRGAVKEARNRPIPGVTIVVRGGGGATVRLTSTDAKGLYRVEGLEDGAYRVEIRRDGFQTLVRPAVEVRAPFRAIVEETLTPGPGPAGHAGPPGALADGVSAIDGIIRDAVGEPLADVRFRATRVGGGADPRVAVTKGDGAFSVEELPNGLWEVELLGPGFLPIRAPLGVSGDVLLEATLARQPANFDPSPIDLIPQEVPIPPQGSDERPDPRTAK